MPKSKKLKQQEAIERNEHFASQTVTKRLEILKGRPGKSQKQRAKLTAVAPREGMD